VTAVDDLDAEDVVGVFQEKVTLTVRVQYRVRHEFTHDDESVIDDVVISPCLAVVCDEMTRAGDLIRPLRDAKHSRPGTAAREIVEELDEVLHRVALQDEAFDLGAHGGLLTGIAARENDDTHVRCSDPEHREHVTARQIGEPEVEHDDVGLQLRRELDRGATVCRLGDDLEPAPQLQCSADQATECLDVVDQQDARCHGLSQ
jgi:hypothetical protein